METRGIPCAHLTLFHSLFPLVQLIRPISHIITTTTTTAAASSATIRDDGGGEDGGEDAASLRRTIEVLRLRNARLHEECAAARRRAASAQSDLAASSAESRSLRSENARLRCALDESEIKRVDLREKYAELCKLKDAVLLREYEAWRYIAEVVPRSYWLSLRLDDDDAAEMRLLQRRMREYCHLLRRGERLEHIHIRPDDETDDQVFLIHSDILLPHWYELVTALSQYGKFDHREGHGIPQLAFGRVELSPKVLDMLLATLRTLVVSELVLENNFFGREGPAFVADVVNHNQHLSGVVIEGNPIEGADDMRTICDAATQNLEYLRLVSTFNGNDPALLNVVLDCVAEGDLKALGLHGNDIASRGAGRICAFLTENPSARCPLEVLDLSGNDLNDDDAGRVADALLRNDTLEELHLKDNRITEVGKRRIVRAIFDASGIDACASSNHLCQVYGLEPDVEESGEDAAIGIKVHQVSEINGSRRQSANRAMKIFTVLAAAPSPSGGDGDRRGDGSFLNVELLGDLSYELIPWVLRLAQEFTGFTPQLSFVYTQQTGRRSADWDALYDNEFVDNFAGSAVFELLRSWVVPLLP